MRRAKIVCTLGPAVESIEKITELIDAGMNMARLNLSHGGHDEHQKRLDLVRTAAKKANKAVAILVDLQGPKIRLGRFSSGPHELSRGDTFTITTDDIAGTKDRVGTTYKGLPGDCKAGDIIMIDDGKVSVQVVAVKGNDVITKVTQPGMVSNKKGISEFNIIEDTTKTNPGCSSLQNLKIHADLYKDITKVDTCNVETINIDEFLLENNLESNFDLVSLDTQGHDFEILNSSDVIFNAKVIVIETAEVELYEGQKVDTEIDALLESKGYYKHYYHKFHSVWGDSLYLKK